MDSDFDVFSKLNQFMNKEEDSYNMDDVSDSQSSATDDDESSGSDSKIIDLRSVEFPTPPPKTLKRGKRAAVAKKSTETLDLTNGSIEISPPKKSRRAADLIATTTTTTTAQETVVIDDNPAATLSGARRGRGRPKAGTPKVVKIKAAPKPKKMTYKQALAVMSNPVIPQLTESPVAVTAAAVAPKAKRKAPAVRQSYDVDLTGDITFDENHSTVPLFQKQALKTPTAKVVEESSDLDDFDIDIIKLKVKIKDVIKLYPYKANQRFYDIYKTLSEQQNVPMSRVVLFNGDRRLNPDDTPEKTGYRISSIYTCRIMEDEDDKIPAFKAIQKENEIVLKFQSDKWKKPIAIKISRVDTFHNAITMLCNDPLVPFKPTQFSLMFDGDAIDIQDTPMDLDFEGGEIIDCRVKV